jgi:anion-transporting  ArsA/GET3 family ATPase
VSPADGARRRAPRRDRPTLEQLVAAKEIVVCCGPGGVGKTTTAAAIGAMAAGQLGARVLVLTVDPARRLADALGIDEFGNAAHQVPEAVLAAAGLGTRGQLWAAMLDTKASWDDLVRRHAPDARTRDTILANRLYTNITGTFVQSHDYIAMERLHELHTSGDYDLVVVDTPPSRNALDFLDAPARMADFFGGRLLRWLTVPYRSRLVTLASKPFYQLADRILGSQFLQEIAEFFVLFQTMEGGFRDRARAVERTLHDPGTTFVVVSTLEAVPAGEAAFFCDELARRDLHLGALVLNKVLPDVLRDPAARSAAAAIGADPAGVASAVRAALGEPAPGAGLLAGVLAEVAGGFVDYESAAARAAELRAELAPAADLVVEVPLLADDLTDVAALAALARAIWS